MMKQVKQIPDNTYTLSIDEIAVIQAMAFYFSGDQTMTPKALKVIESLKDQFQMHPAVLDYKVWRMD